MLVLKRTQDLSLEEVRKRAVQTTAMGEGTGHSGASLERVTFADGTVIVIKHIRLNDDLMMRATRDPGRAALLWTTGVLDRLPPSIDPAIVFAEPTREGWVLAMHDVSRALITRDRVLTRSESLRVLDAVSRMHRAFEGESIPHLCTLAEFYGLSSPSTWRRISPLRHPLRSKILLGWERFGDRLPVDVTSAVFAILDRPALLARELEKHAATLVHGDLWYSNLGLTDDRVVLIDWGLATRAPGAVDFAGYLMEMAVRIGETREVLIDDFRALQEDRYEERALHLALLGALVQMGWSKAYHASEDPDPIRRAYVATELDWWVCQIRRSLETWSPV